jgi:hypothetical protein
MAVSATDTDSQEEERGDCQDAMTDAVSAEAALLEAQGDQPQSVRQLWSQL